MSTITRFAVRNNGRVLTDVRRPNRERLAAKAILKKPAKAKSVTVNVGPPKATVTVKSKASDNADVTPTDG